MLTRKPSYTQDDANAGNPLFAKQGQPVDFAVVPPTPSAGDRWEGGQPEACRLVAVNLSAYLDNELDPDQSEMVTAHLEACADCADLLDAMYDTDEEIQREWREDTPLPSSSQFRRSIDAIMDALPAEPVAEPVFAPKRVHARTRWVRFATGMSGMVVIAAMLWSSYRIGYVQGRQNASKSAFVPANPTGYNPAYQPETTLATLIPASARPPEDPLTLNFARERRSHR